ncbi:MAG: FimB/Mfa2 family fimbrial subunit [Bacteroidales bacterium]|nr:FimB/Mfa2 family fimbrial subunit [Bacteroidales bacterium]
MLFFPKCTKEDLTDCGVIVRFKYDKHVQGISFSDEIKSIDLYVFDENGAYIETRSSLPSDATVNGFLPETYQVVMRDRKPGTYTFIAWGNVKREFFDMSTLNVGASTFNTATLNYIRDERNERGPTLSLFHGSQMSVNLESHTIGSKIITIDLMKYAKHVVVTIAGFPEGFDLDNFNCYIVSSNGNYRFNGSFGNPNPPITYNPTITVMQNGSVVEFDFYILREDNDNLTNSKLVISYTGQDGTEIILRQESLVSMLRLLPKSGPNARNTGDLDIDHEFFIDVEIEIEDDGTNATASIFIEYWDQTPQIPKPLG